MSRNAGILLKLINDLPFIQLKQLYYSLIYPYISYAIISWSSAYTSHLKKIQTKQNHIVQLMFFITLYGENTESAGPLLNLQELLNVENINKPAVFIKKEELRAAWRCALYWRLRVLLISLPGEFSAGKVKTKDLTKKLNVGLNSPLIRSKVVTDFM